MSTFVRSHTVAQERGVSLFLDEYSDRRFALRVVGGAPDAEVGVMSALIPFERARDIAMAFWPSVPYVETSQDPN